MEQLPGGFVGELLKLGIAGCFILYLIVVNFRKDRLIQDKDKQIESLQDRRAAEAATNAIALGQSAGSNDKLAEAVTRVSAAVEQLQNAAFPGAPGPWRGQRRTR